MTTTQIDSADFRRVLGQYPTGVCAITATEADGTQVGLTVGSFTSVSIDPPLVGFFPDRGSSSWPRIARIGRFCVNVLSSEQEHVCRAFATRGGDKFAGLTHEPSALGSPIIDDALAWIDCEVYSVSDAGDHLFVLGLVRELKVGTAGSPLLFCQGGYGRFARNS